MSTFDYDLIVIGGGSGGMSCAKKAASLGAKVLIFDYVKPSTQGNTWGLGGTCVNVGCVPKKLCHYAGLLGHSLHDSSALGWTTDKASHNWEKLIETVENHVRMLNFRYRVALKNKNVTYVNALATLSSPNSVSYNLAGKNGGEKTVSAQYIVIAVGGRPYIPSNVSGALEYAITSDDIFYLEKSPGKTLCVGGSYISLECAGFLAELGYDVTVSARSILLRGFDRQCAEKVGEVMFNNGVKFLMGTSPSSITKLADGRLQVVLEDSRGAESLQTFDTVLFATGRQPDVSQLNLAGVGINFIPETGKIPVVNEQTNVPSIFAIGDVCEGKQELTPVAIKAGELLAKRLFGGSRELMDYNTVATTVFTPSEYGSVGLSEEEAVQMYGEADVEVYLSEFTTLEYSAVHRMKHKMHGDDEDFGHNCLSKLVCIRSQEEKVVGFHFVGPNAGEITQGFALAVKLGAKKSDFDNNVGIHPTDAESFSALSITKRSGIPFAAEGGCGGGVCG